MSECVYMLAYLQVTSCITSFECLQHLQHKCVRMYEYENRHVTWPLVVSGLPFASMTKC